MNQELVIEKTINFIKGKMLGEGSGHDWYHVERVYKAAKYIAQKEGAILYVVSLAALLHDIEDHKFHQGNSDIGAVAAKEWLNQLNVEEEVVQQVKEIIKTISFKAGTETKKQETLEGMVVQDADRLDAIGAIGIARTFAYGGNKNREMYNPKIKPHKFENYNEYLNTQNHTINHFYEKLLLLKDLMNTKTGKEIAESRHQFMEEFLNQFFKEWDGLDFE